MRKFKYIFVIIALLSIIACIRINNIQENDLVEDEELAENLAKIYIEQHFEGVDKNLKYKATSKGREWYITLDYEYYYKVNNISCVDFGYEVIIRKKDGKVKSISRK